MTESLMIRSHISHAINSLVGKLLIGYLDTEPDSDEEDDSSPLYVMPGSVDGFAMPAPRPPTAKK